jgi:hypothetical protein
MNRFFTVFSIAAALGISASSARGTPDFVQQAHRSSGSTPVSSLAVSYGAAINAGNTLMAWVVAGNSCISETFTVADNVNGPWTPVGSAQADGQNCSQAQWFYFVGAKGGTTQVTLTLSASELADVTILEYSGIEDSVYDAAAGAKFPPHTNTLMTPGITTTLANDLVLAAIGFVCCGQPSSFGAVNVAAPYSMRSAGGQTFIAEQIAPSAGNTPGAQFTLQWGQAVEAATVAFKSATAGSGGSGGSGGTSNATLVLCPNNGQTGNRANCQSPPTLAFGKQGTNTLSAALKISVNNCSTPNIANCTGSGSLTLGSPYFTITGTNAADFSNTGQGSCANDLVITSGGSCTIVLQFTPRQAPGAEESATLTVNSNGVGNPQTMSLTGTDAAVTAISSCQALAGNTNYQLSANVSAPGTCFTVTRSNTDINLNGFTITYCSSSQSSLVAGVLINDWNVGNTTVHNGVINEGPGTCSGLAPANNAFGPGAVITSSNGTLSSSYGTTMFNLTATVKAKEAKVLREQYFGGTTSSSTVMHDVLYTDEDSTACASGSCRQTDQFYAVVVATASNAPPSHFYNIIGVGGTQGGIMTTAPGSVLQNNLISPGSAAATTTNGFVFQGWGAGVVIENNLTIGNGSGGSCLSCRGVQIASVGPGSVNGSLVQNNVLYTTNLPNDQEYGGCQGGGSYGIQINNTGSGDTSNNTFQNNKVTVTASACPGFGFSWSNATLEHGPNHTISNRFVCNLAPGSTPTPCAGINLIGNEYSPHPDNAVDSQQDTYLGDTSAIHVHFDGTPAWTCSQCTFGKGSNPVSNWMLFDNNAGVPSAASSNPIVLVDPTFTGGASKSSNNLKAWAASNPSLSSSYAIRWTYTVTVKGASSGNAIAGAAVSAKDSQFAQECSGTTNASGVFSCVVNDTKYAAIAGTYTVTTFNPFQFQISATGCTALSYNLTITATTKETRQLGGC